MVIRFASKPGKRSTSSCRWVSWSCAPSRSPAAAKTGASATRARPTPTARPGSCARTSTTRTGIRRVSTAIGNGKHAVPGALTLLSPGWRRSLDRPARRQRTVVPRPAHDPRGHRSQEARQHGVDRPDHELGDRATRSTICSALPASKLYGPSGQRVVDQHQRRHVVVRAEAEPGGHDHEQRPPPRAPRRRTPRAPRAAARKPRPSACRHTRRRRPRPAPSRSTPTACVHGRGRRHLLEQRSAPR